MDLMLLRIFQQHVLDQSQGMLRAAQDVNARMATRDLDGMFFALQNLLNAAANVSQGFFQFRIDPWVSFFGAEGAMNEVANIRVRHVRLLICEDFGRPFHGLGSLFVVHPSTEVLGYCQSSAARTG